MFKCSCFIKNCWISQDVTHKFLTTLNSFHKCCFKSFSEEHHYIFKERELSIDDARRLTSYNTWLLSSVPSQVTELSKIDRLIVSYVLRYVKNLLDSFGFPVNWNPQSYGFTRLVLIYHYQILRYVVYQGSPVLPQKVKLILKLS